MEMTAYELYNAYNGHEGCNECPFNIQKHCKRYLEINGFCSYSEKIFDGFAIMIDEKEY